MSYKPLYINPTDETPQVILDPENNRFEFVGNSYPENSTKFYSPILNWMKEYIDSSPKQDLSVDFNFDYFNTSSAKYILEILRLIQDHQDKGNKCLIRWYYFQDDTDMLEAGEDYQMTITVPFEIIERTDTF
jgi:hypothetical protein